MPLIRLTQILIGLLLILSTTLVAMGERNMIKSLIMLVAVCASFVFTDLLGWIRLNRFISGVLAVGVLFYSLLDAFQLESQRQLEAIATLQTFLEVILLFQVKNPRLYWQLVVLSLGQVMVACALSIGLMFGVLLLVYSFVATICLTLLLLYRESLAVGSSTNLLQFGRPVTGWTERPAENIAVSPRLTAFAPIVGHASTLLVLTVGVAATLFFLMPRFRAEAWQGIQEQPLRVVGYSSTVTLGDLGAVVQDPDVVMRMRFIDPESGRPYEFQGEPLLRGSVVSEYGNRKWTQPRGSTEQSEAVVDRPLVRQEISIEPLDEPVLFAVAPVVLVPNDKRIGLNRRKELIRIRDYQDQRLTFSVSTTGIVNHKQASITPLSEELPVGIKKNTLLQMPQGADDPLEGLKEISQWVIDESKLPEADRIGRARALEKYLRDSGKFAYSLDAQSRDARLDPLEDFVVYRPIGHCEYFAGALTIMLRSQDIPARMVIGFKGGEYNAAGGYYQIRQLHAHIWVEAYLEREHYQPGENEEGYPGYWLLLDPTTLSEDDPVNARGAGWWAGMGHYFDYAQVLWSNYVVGLTSDKQEESIYQPIAAAATQAADKLLDADYWQEKVSWLTGDGATEIWSWYKQNWFNWRGGLAAALLCLTLVALVKMTQTAWRGSQWVKRRFTSPKAGTRQVVDFYVRLERAIARQGIKRLPAQTQHEFALAASSRLAETVELAGLASIPTLIVDSFYRLRFGGRPLDSSELARVEHALTSLEQAPSLRRR